MAAYNLSYSILVKFICCLCAIVFLFNTMAMALITPATFGLETTFDSVGYLKPNEKKKAEEIGGQLEVIETGVIRFRAKGTELINLNKSQIIGLVYERNSTPRYAAGLLIAWPLLFTKSKKHFLTIQYKNADGKGEFALFRLDKSNYQQILAAVEAAAGIKVERSID